MRAWSVAVVLVFLGGASIAACQGPTFIVQQYAGAPRPPETIAILRVNGGEPIRLLVLDDEDVAAPVASDGRLHIELLPGRHTLTARHGDDPRAPFGSLVFVAEAGRTYRVLFEGGQPHAYEVGRGDDRPTRDVTAPKEAPAPLPPPAALPNAAPEAGTDDGGALEAGAL